MHLRPALLAAALACAATVAAAHDTWFEALPGAGATRQLALGTGNVYPLQESGIDAKYLVEQGCRAGRVATTLQPLRNEATALVLRAAPGATTCWAQLAPFEVTLAPDKIALYLREVGAGPELRATWAAMQQRGLPWRERYTKHARIELGAPSASPAPLGLDLLIHHSGPVQAGELLDVQVLRDGQPLPGQAVELRSDSSPLGIWRRSGADGRLQVAVPAAGHWLLRAVDLRLSASAPDTWDSRFVTLAFEAGPQNGSSLNSNTRSASQMPATSAMASEPPSSTTRR
jgi:hypothetical protein